MPHRSTTLSRFTRTVRSQYQHENVPNILGQSSMTRATRGVGFVVLHTTGLRSSTISENYLRTTKKVQPVPRDDEQRGATTERGDQICPPKNASNIR